jgi:hypothetical protein
MEAGLSVQTKGNNMSGRTSRLAYIARSGERFEYFGNARNGLCIPLTSGDGLAINPDQIQQILDRFSVFNPLLDEFTDHGIYCPTTRLERWVEEESPVFFGRQLKSGDAMRILGAFNGEGLIEEHFHSSNTRHDHSLKADALAKLEECKGLICIYREKAYFARVRLVKVTGDINGASLRMEVIDTPGFCSDVTGQFEVGSVFEYLSICSGYVVTSLVSWVLVTYPAMVSHLTDFAAHVPGKPEFIDEMNALTRGKRTFRSPI